MATGRSPSTLSCPNDLTSLSQYLGIQYQPPIIDENQMGGFFVGLDAPKMKPKYKKLEPSNVRGICVKCNKNPQKGTSGGKFRSLCSPCDKTRTEASRIKRNKTNNMRLKRHLKPRNSSCERCGFVPEHICQLDIDHIDGDKNNNDHANHMTLCSNCHRLKTFLNRDWRRYENAIKAA